jgi:hypothetical protein
MRSTERGSRVAVAQAWLDKPTLWHAEHAEQLPHQTCRHPMKAGPRSKQPKATGSKS